MLKNYQASVALIAFSKNISDDLLKRKLVFIKRSEHPDDPWSGHVAFPGGGFETADRTRKATSIRECYEEVGINLNKGKFKQFVSEVVSKKSFKNSKLSIKSYLFFSSVRPTFFDVSEVSDVFDVALEAFFEERHYVRRDVSPSEYPQLGFQTEKNKYFIWGITLAILLDFLSRQFPEKIKKLSFFEEYQHRKNNYLSFYTTEKISN